MVLRKASFRFRESDSDVLILIHVFCLAGWPACTRDVTGFLRRTWLAWLSGVLALLLDMIRTAEMLKRKLFKGLEFSFASRDMPV